jgi:hypothetical protein
MTRFDSSGTPIAPLFNTPVHVRTVDDEGRLDLKPPTPGVAWSPHQAVGLTVEADLLRLSDVHGAFDERTGARVELDERSRLRLPYGVRLMTGLLSGALVVLLETVDSGLLIVPVSRLLANAEADDSV